MSPDGSQLLILLIVLTIIRAFFTSLEYIIVEVNDAKIKELAEENEKYKKQAAPIIIRTMSAIGI